LEKAAEEPKLFLPKHLQIDTNYNDDTNLYKHTNDETILVTIFFLGDQNRYG
jgi:hypothetical protein